MMALPVRDLPAGNWIYEMKFDGYRALAIKAVGVDSYDHEMPLGGLLGDALVLPLFDGGNMEVRRRQLHDLMRAPGYDPLAAAG
jgi:hypothetical protein